LAFASGLSVLSHDQGDFAGIPPGLMTLIEVSMGMVSAQHYTDYQHDPMVLFVVFVFILFAVVFLLNLLIAQLTCAYQSIYEDMIGYARLNRIDIIVETMPTVSKSRWQAFVESLRLDKKIEFNAGDIGVNGGVQLKEAANLNVTTKDQIRRFGGSTSLSVQFPEEEGEDGDESDRFERLEKLIQKALKRITHGGGGGKKKGGVSGTSGTGSGTGSGAEEKSGGSGGSEEGDDA